MAKGRIQTTRRLIPFGLNREEYENSMDRKLLYGLRKLKPLNFVMRLFLSKWNIPKVETVHLAMGIKVSNKQARPIYKICEECAKILGVNLPDIYVIQEPYLNAYTYGDGKEKNFIVLHSSLIDALNDDELYYMIGHEMGHVASEHVFYLTIAHWLGIGADITTDMLAELLGPLVKVSTIVIKPSLLAWLREAEITADCAGLICCQNVDIACKTLAKVRLGSEKLADMIDMEEILAQSKELERRGIPAKIEKWTKLDHPFLSTRIRKLIDFYKSTDYKDIFNGRPLICGQYRLREDYYERLKLRRGISEKMVESAYKALVLEAKKRFKNEDRRTERLRRLKEACNVLKNSELREQYNRLLKKRIR